MRCDVLVGLEGFHVVDVDAGRRRLRVIVEPAPPTRRCTWRGSAPRTSEPSTTSPPRPRAGRWPSLNGLIELHRRVTRGFRDRENYRLRMLLTGGGLHHPRLA